MKAAVIIVKRILAQTTGGGAAAGSDGDCEVRMRNGQLSALVFWIWLYLVFRAAVLPTSDRGSCSIFINHVMNVISVILFKRHFAPKIRPQFP